jgi:drug/metabolite transporter (DMT)-like permease
MSANGGPAGRSRAIGIVMMLLAGLCLSVGGLITRYIQTATGWQLMVYRAAGMVVVLLAILAIKERGRILAPFRAMGWGGLAAAIVLATSMIAYLFALLLTSVANTMFVVSSAPFFAALIGWLLLKERVRVLTWIAIAAAVIGMGIMFAGGFATGHLAGLVTALAAAVTYALLVVMLRRFRNVDMLPALILAALLAGAASAAVAGDIAVPTNDMLLGLLMGAVQTAGGFGFIMLGARRVPAAEGALVLLVEPILAPIWVWIFVAEVPSTVALVGGVIVLGAVLAQAVASVAWERRPLPA